MELNIFLRLRSSFGLRTYQIHGIEVNKNIDKNIEEMVISFFCRGNRFVPARRAGNGGLQLKPFVSKFHPSLCLMV